ncbi:MAG: DUF1648 domain-containing protein [Acidobacteria bacterium]|nr:DUF1648 domain-containing protein [Acidobacteriota bacterium]
MTHTTTLLVFWFAFDILMFGLMLYMPIMRKEEAFFGTRVSPETYQGIGREILNRYRFWLVLTFIQVEVLGLVLSLYRNTMPLARIVSLPILITASMIFYVIFARQVKQYESIEENQRFATSLKVRHLSDYTSISLEIAIAITIMIPTLVLIYYYPLLPDKIPVHWDLLGRPDKWAEKNIFSVFFLPVIMVYLQGLFWLIKYGMLQAKMTLPAEVAEEFFALKEESLKVGISLLDQIRLLQAILMGAISLNILSATLGNGDVTKWIIVLAILADVVILVLCAYNISKIMKIEDKLKAISGRSYVENARDAKHWYGGGMFYYNPDDPALFIEKKVGYGYTMNFANKQIFLYIGYGLLLPISILILSSLGKL